MYVNKFICIRYKLYYFLKYCIIFISGNVVIYILGLSKSIEMELILIVMKKK